VPGVVPPTPPPLDGVSHEFIDAAGLRMHVALAGDEAAPALLLLHGWPQNWWLWRAIIPALAPHFRVIAPDLRGHGWSDAPVGGYEKEQLASDVFALLDALGVTQVTWVGHDWGGYSGFLAALREPQRIARMLALCIPHPWLKPDIRRLGLMLSYQGPISLPFLGPAIAARSAPRIVQAGRRRDERLAPDDVRVFVDHLPRRVTVAMYRTFLTREVIPVARGRYANAVLEVPTTLAIGDRDLVTRGIAAGPVKGQPNLTVEVVPGAAHWAPEQQPRVVIDWCLRGAAGP
jgi:pimeloyl-ACP methyl ester carboxylesterase